MNPQLAHTPRLILLGGILNQTILLGHCLKDGFDTFPKKYVEYLFKGKEFSKHFPIKENFEALLHKDK